MLNRFFNFKLCLLCAVSFPVVPAFAARECKAPAEMVTTLFHPDPGTYSVWTGIIGEPVYEEIYRSVLPLDDGAVIAAGEFRGNNSAAPQLLITQTDGRGRKKQNNLHNIEGLNEVKKIIPVGGGYMIAMNMKTKGGAGFFRFGFYDKDGKEKNHTVFNTDKFDLKVEDVIISTDGKFVYAAVVRTSKEKSGNNSTIMKNESGLFILDTNGTKIEERFYIPGKNSVLKNLSFAKFSDKDSGLIATGWFENDFGKRIGWVLGLNDKGVLVWQREFERGLAASVEKSAYYNERSVLVFGEVVPADSGSIGSWLMMLNSSDGSVKWQRYYNGETGAHDYYPRGVMVNKDGLIIAAMQAEVDTDKNHMNDVVKGGAPDSLKSAAGKAMAGDKAIPVYMSYAHLLTLDPRGVTISGDSFFDGAGVQLSQIVSGRKGERLLVGSVTQEDGAIPKLLSGKEEENAADAEKAKQESVKVNLPQVELSEETLKGLALLGNKMKGNTEGINQADSVKPENGLNQALPEKDDGKSLNGWIVTATSLEAYTDPCVSSVKKLNSR